MAFSFKEFIAFRAQTAHTQIIIDPGWKPAPSPRQLRSTFHLALSLPTG